MKILYLGVDTGTSQHRAQALKRLGHDVVQINPEQFLPKNAALCKFHWETGGLFCEQAVTSQVLSAIGSQTFDLAWVNGGRYVGPGLVRHLQRQFGPVVNYNSDDPYSTRDRFSWLLFRKTIPCYDLIAVVRQENVAEAYQRGAQNVMRVFMSADEVAHAPRLLTHEDHQTYDSDVLFIGTWMEDRGAFMAKLIQQGVLLSIRGGRWQRAREWPILSKFWKGPATKTPDEYAKAIQCSKISLGLLSKGNRDLHTQRSLEVPYLGGLFCAERTAEHMQLYCEGEEAVFWSDADECAAVCKTLLADEDMRREIARRGQQRSQENGHLNEQVLSGMIAQAMQYKRMDMPQMGLV